MDVIKRIPSGSIDFILTDPPYNLARHSTGNIPLPGRSPMNNDVANWDMVEFNPEDWADEFIRILKPTGNLFIFTSYNQLGRWYNCLDHKFDTSNFMIWHKTNPAPKIFKAGFLNSCEMIFTCWNKKHTWNFISQAEMHNFIESPICMRPERLRDPKHPTQKPVAILKKMIEIASNKGDIVFDPFMGVGSVGVAALELDRRFIGVEIDETYFAAAGQRIDRTLDLKAQGDLFDTTASEISKAPAVCEPEGAYGLPFNTFPDSVIDNMKVSSGQPSLDMSSGLSPIIKWPGGKEKELKFILPKVPVFSRFIEPFVGGGAVFTGITAQEYLINDLSEELIDLYDNISSQDRTFFDYVNAIDSSWRNMELLCRRDNSLLAVYEQFRGKAIDETGLKACIKSFCESNRYELEEISGPYFRKDSDILLKEVETNLLRKMKRMRQLEMDRHPLPDKDKADNIETALKSALYMFYRTLYNRKTDDTKLHCALFFFIRNYAYSGMFRYSGNGLFNVPYGGMAYNSKSLSKKIAYYQSKPLSDRFLNTRIYNLDFKEFLDTVQPSEDDFVFLDPPYDSDFSTYARNEFTKADQKRLANYLIHNCKAKWMMIIKNTDFIYNLYNIPGINITSFDKEYTVSFMNRNDRKVTHLMITNYP